MTFSFLASSLLIASVGNGWASENKNTDEQTNASTEEIQEQRPEGAPAPVEEIIVHGEMEIARKRSKVIQNLKHMGYREAVRKDGRSILRPDTPYQPTIVLDDDAWMHVKRSPVRIDPPGKKDNNLRYLWCLPPFTITAACVQIGGQVIAQRKLAHFKDDIARATDFEMRQWRSAIVENAMERRIGEEIPDMLDRIWEEGKPPDVDEVLLAQYPERRAAILGFWANRSCLPEGAAVRNVVSDFIVEVIHHSPHPASPGEIAEANQEQRCSDATLLPIPRPATP